MDRKKLPIGYEDIKEIIDRNAYFVDKSLMIKDLLESNAKSTLITRPRRFGKTLNMSMIRRYFEDERRNDGTRIDNSYLFSDLKISRDKDFESKYRPHMGQYPVINLTLKSAKQDKFDDAYKSMLEEIRNEFDRHSYVLSSDISEEKKIRFERILCGDGENIDYAKAFAFLSKCLYEYHHKNVIILIDEYDVPLENAYFKNFYDRMTGFVRSLFESCLKTNPYLELGVITGCLRISKESIFTGLNNLDVCSVLDQKYAPYYGFTDDEIKEILEYNGITKEYEELKSWYDGYLFGKTEIYNPWSMVKYIDDKISENVSYPEAYWVNTSSNDIVKSIVEKACDTDSGYNAVREDLQTIMDGGIIEKVVHKEVTYGDVFQSNDNIWNFLMFTGYLKSCGIRYDGHESYVSLTIPNREVASVYRRSIIYWFEQKSKALDTTPLIRAFEEGDCETAEDFISAQLNETISFHDYAENFYHGFMAGLLLSVKGYTVKSNRETGKGRSDIILATTRIRRGRVIILELKVAKTVKEMEKKCEEGLRQIEEKDYERPFVVKGYPKVDKYAICFLEKECMVKHPNEQNGRLGLP